METSISESTESTEGPALDPVVPVPGSGSAAGPTPRNGHGGKRPGTGRPKGSGYRKDYVTVSMARDLVARARFVAGSKAGALPAYLTEAARPVIDRDFARAVEQGGRDQGTGDQPATGAI